MKRFLLSSTFTSGCLLFLLVYSFLAHRWVTSDILWVNTIIEGTTQFLLLLIATLIGLHLRQPLSVKHSRDRHVLLLYLAIGYSLLQLINYPLQHPIINPLHWPSLLTPQGFGTFIGAALMVVSATISFRQWKEKQHWREYILPVSLVLLMAALTIFYKNYYGICIFLATAAGLFIAPKLIRSRVIFFSLSNIPKPWFYRSLIFASLIVYYSPAFFSDAGLALNTMECVIISIVIVFISTTSPIIILGDWINGWLNWASGRKGVSNLSSHHAPSNKKSGFDTLMQSRMFTRLLPVLLAAIRIISITTLAFLIIELPIRNWSINSVFVWASDSAFFTMLAYGTILVCYFSLRTLLSWHAATALLLIVAGITSGVSAVKTRYLGLPLIPSDLNLISQALDSLIFIAGKIKALFVFFMLFLVLILFSLTVWYFSKYLLNKSPWIGLRGLLAFCVAFWLLQPGKWSLNDKLPSVWESGNSSGLYRKVGFITGFLVRYQQFYIQQPKNFSKDSIATLANQLNISLENNPEQIQQVGNFRQPHIIAIQSEAFWDPGLLHTNLYPFGSPGNLSVLCLNSNNYCKTGYVEVPVFGGGTANSEYEFLTGLSMNLLPSGTVPFVHYIQHPVASIGWRLQQANYQTLGIHPNAGLFWNRDKAYPLLGFEEFIDINSFDNAEKNQFYVSDRAINHIITQRIEYAQQPQFIFAVTMANHAPFVDKRYSSLPEEPIDWNQLPSLTADEQQAIKTYSIGVRESRAALKELVDTYSVENAPPVIIVFYGDHLPILGENYSIYHKSGFKRENMTDRFREFFSTPYLVWSNQLISSSLMETMPVSLLGQEVLTIAGLGRSGLQQTVSQLQETSFLRKPTRAHILGSELPSPLNEQQRAVVKLYRHANFDALFHQHTPAFFGLVSPTTKKPVANLDVDQ